jgi:cysteinyl-tRNA synthetase
MYIYNTLSGEKEELTIQKNRPLRLFVCGPTVYDSPHLGHARTEITFDVLARFLRSQGIKLTYLKNITDVDDKIIARAKERTISPFLLAKQYEREYKEMNKAIGIISINTFARASNYIPAIVKQINTLIQKEYAYKIPTDGWYFDIAKFKDYGKLSRRTASQAEDAVTRIDENIKKRNRGDFCLWKFVATKQTANKGIEYGEPFWKTEIGIGRPGWHIEDTAITETFFGPQYDIHGGAVDLKFPHHEAEIAQQESASGKKPFVRYWVHAGFLLVEGKKMSKSLGNFITIHEFLEKNLNGAQLLRFSFLNSHYRTPMNFSEEGLLGAKNGFENLSLAIDTLEFIGTKSVATKSKISVAEILKQLEKNFVKAMEDDLNTPDAIAKIFETLNTLKPNFFELSKTDAKKVAKTVRAILKILGIVLPIQKIPLKTKALARQRDLYRGNKQFTQSDTLRDSIHALGYEVNDTPFGSFVRKK